ncbi:MAG: hypothetical protein LBI99_02290, partial [Propionibacteriaceae bacterium]|nr:hypothetical protein [Propionibacteriaceae bacterium]
RHRPTQPPPAAGRSTRTPWMTSFTFRIPAWTVAGTLLSGHSTASPGGKTGSGVVFRRPSFYNKATVE